MLKAFYYSEILKYTIVLLIGLHCLTIIIRSKDDSESKTLILDSIEKAPLVGYTIEVFIGILSHGLFFDPKSYLKVSKMNYINLLVVVIFIVCSIPTIGALEVRILKRFTILKIFTLLARTNK